MAEKTKLIIISDCRIPDFHDDERDLPHHVEKGETFEVDLENKKHAALVSQLMHAGRVAVATPEVVKEIQAEIAAEKKRLEKLAKQFAVTVPVSPATLSDSEILRLVTERGLIKK